MNPDSCSDSHVGLKVIPNNGNEYPKEFRQIIKNIYLESDPDKEAVNFIWEAFIFSHNAHK